MECTQRLECTQELSSDCVPRTCAEQVGILGIYGTTYPIKMGPNKIGRDPQTCDIAIDLKSLSRQHAVINILSSTEYMIMDLGSINKTKLGNRALQPYMPHPLRHGDVLQLGDACGLFRACSAADDELPATQCLEPEAGAGRGRLVVPESPDVSDKDDSFNSFIGASQKPDVEFKTPNRFMRAHRPSRAPAAPAAPGRINNVFWTSAETSLRLSLEGDTPGRASSTGSSNSTTKLMDTADSTIHEMDTQVPVDSPDSIHMANTQLPVNGSPSIHTLDTQIPVNGSPSIHSVDTQLPVDRSPALAKLNGEIELCAKSETSIHNTETQMNDVFEAETQDFLGQTSIHDAHTQFIDKDHIHDIKTQAFGGHTDTHEKDVKDRSVCKQTSGFESDEDILFDDIEEAKVDKSTESSKGKQNSACGTPNVKTESDEEILFEAMDDEDIPCLDSQQLLGATPDNLVPTEQPSQDSSPVIPKGAAAKRRIIDSDSESEDIAILPTQMLTTKAETSKEDDLEDIAILPTQVYTTRTDTRKVDDSEDIAILPTQMLTTKTVSSKVDDCDDIAILPTQMITNKREPNKANHYEEMDTQLLDEHDMDDMPTQILEEDVAHASRTSNKSNTCFEDQPTQLLDDDDIKNDLGFDDEASPFKIPILSPLKVRRKDIPKLDVALSTPEVRPPDDRYYMATQDILDVLCTQADSDARRAADNDIVPCSDDEVVNEDDFRHIDAKSPLSLSGDSHIEAYVSGLGSQQVRDVIGAVKVSCPVKKSSSDLSDLEVTPKKALIEIELPDTQEIKTNMGPASSVKTLSSSESEPEAEEQNTPILFKKKTRVKRTAKVDLTNKFEAESLPTRVSTRARRPTPRLLQGDQVKETMLKPRFLSSQDDSIDRDILTENIQRLKNVKKHDKVKPKAKSTKDSSVEAKDSNVEATASGKKSNDEKLKEKDIKNDASKKSQRGRKKTVKDVDTDKANDDKSEKKKGDKKDKNTEPKPELETKRVRKSRETKEEETIQKKNDSSKSRRNKDKEQTKSGDKSKIDTKSSNKSKETRSRTSKSKDESKPKDDNSKTKTSTDEKSGTKRTRSSRNKPADQTKRSLSPRPVRRSRRRDHPTATPDHPTAGTDRPTAGPDRRTNSELRLEQSTVYNLSTGSSGAESPRGLKRPAGDVLEQSNKRPRSVTPAVRSTTPAPRSVTPAVSLRSSTPKPGQHYVLFTAFPNEDVKAALEKLGATLVSDVQRCTVLVTQQVRRTFKLLCCVGLRRPVVGAAWLRACADAGALLDPWQYLLEDAAAERRFAFSLRAALRRPPGGFLRGRRVGATPAVLPAAPEMKMIVECSGGTWVGAGPAGGAGGAGPAGVAAGGAGAAGGWLCVSTARERALWPALRRRGAAVVTPELILSGVLRQELDVEGNLFP